MRGTNAISANLRISKYNNAEYSRFVDCICVVSRANKTRQLTPNKLRTQFDESQFAAANLCELCAVACDKATTELAPTRQDSKAWRLTELRNLCSCDSPLAERAYKRGPQAPHLCQRRLLNSSFYKRLHDNCRAELWFEAALFGCEMSCCDSECVLLESASIEAQNRRQTTRALCCGCFGRCFRRASANASATRKQLQQQNSKPKLNRKLDRNEKTVNCCKFNSTKTETRNKTAQVSIFASSREHFHKSAATKVCVRSEL